MLRPEGGGGGGGGGGVKVDFTVFTYLIRAAGDEQEGKKPERNLTPNSTVFRIWGKINLIFREQRQISKFCT